MVVTRGSNAAAGAAQGSQATSDRSSNDQAAAPAAPAAPLQARLAALHPAILQQLLAVGPALDAFVAAMDPNQAGAGDARTQPEREPDEETKSDSEDQDASRLAKDKFKVDLRNIKVERFDGTVAPGSFDAKAREFCEELDDQMDDAQALAGQVWTEDIKKAVFKMFLTGMARRWYRDWRVANPAASYQDGVDALMHTSRPVLLGVDVAEQIKKERKRWSQTYREFSDRLLQMAHALEGGKAVPANARHALVAFVRNAYPKYTDFLETKINLDGEKPETLLKEAVAVLSRKAGTDGRMPERVKPKPTTNAPTTTKLKVTKPQTKKTQPSSAKGTRENKKRPAPAEVNAAVVERKKKPKVSSNASSTGSSKGGFKCYECGTLPSSAASTCKATKTASSGRALNVEVDEDAEQDDDQ